MANEQGLSPISIRSHLKAGGLNLQLDRLMAIDSGMLGVLKGWKQRTQFASEDDWILQAQFSLAVFRSLIPLGLAGVPKASARDLLETAI